MTNITDNTKSTKSSKALYWLATSLACLALMAIGASDILHAPPVIDGLTKLGYPPYFATIIGVWMLLGVTALLVPGFPRLREWAYAGLFFTLTGASMSHAISGDSVGHILFPLVLLGVVAVSWALRTARAAVIAEERSKIAPTLIFKIRSMTCVM